MGPAAFLPGTACPGMAPITAMVGISSATPNPVSVDPDIAGPWCDALVIVFVRGLRIDIAACTAGSEQGGG